MPCDYKKTLSEAAARGDASLDEGVRDHLESCTDCQEFFACEQALFATIDTSVQRISNANSPPVLLAKVRAAIALKPTSRSNRAFLWAPVAAAVLLAVSPTAWVVRHYSSGPSEIQPIAAVNVGPAWTAPPGQDTHPVIISRTNRRKSSNASLRIAVFHPLVSAGQSETINRLVENIRTGEIDGGVLVAQPNQDLQIPPIVIPPLTVADITDEQSNSRLGISGIPVSQPSLDVDRSTR